MYDGRRDAWTGGIGECVDSESEFLGSCSDGMVQGEELSKMGSHSTI